MSHSTPVNRGWKYAYHADAHRVKGDVERSLDMVVHIARMDGKRFIREIHEVERE
jgi:hypothetical protein